MQVTHSAKDLANQLLHRQGERTSPHAPVTCNHFAFIIPITNGGGGYANGCVSGS